MKKAWVILSAALLMLLMSMRAEAASEGDVYAALRSIGVPESYVSQAAGVLARGRSDGAGVYRSDGTYYSYSWMVSYIYANRETILLYCGVDPDTGGAATSAPAETASPGTETTTAAGIDIASAIDMMFADETAAETTAAPETETTAETTTTTAAAVTAAAETSRTTTSRSAARISDVTTGEEHGSGGITGLAAGMIAAAAAGLTGVALMQRKKAE